MIKDREHILIVDDDPVNLRLLDSLLAEHGFAVRSATGRTMALNSVRIEAPDLILLDIYSSMMSTTS